jgi:phosphonate transport system permease protein
VSWPSWTPRAFTLALLVLFVVAMGNIGLLDLPRLARGVANSARFVAEMFPPNPNVLATVVIAIVETLQIAFVGTVLGFAAALPMALAATRALFGPALTGPTRMVLAAVRTVPSLFWGIVFVVAVGLGPAAGALGIAFYSLGYLGKLFYEIFEGVDPEVVEAVRAVGAGPLQLARFAILPESANSVVAQLLFMFEYNVRASSIMGFVGAGGVGFYLLGYIQLLQYDRALTTLIATLLVVIAIDQISARVRRLFIVPASVGAPA